MWTYPQFVVSDCSGPTGRSEPGRWPSAPVVGKTLGSLLFLLTASAPGVSAASTAGAGPSGRSGAAIAFLRSGDLWLASATGKGERRLTQGGGYRGLAAHGRRVAVVAGRSGDLVLLAAPGWREQRFTQEERFLGPVCWRPGTRELFAARELSPDGGDDGLWRLDTGRKGRQKILNGVKADLSVHRLVRLSPSGTRVAAGGVVDEALAIQARDLHSEARWSPLAGAPFYGGVDFAWLGEERLLLAGAPAPKDLPGLGGWPPTRGVVLPAAGLHALEIRTGRMLPWLYPRGTSVLRICRAPGRRDRYAVGVGDARAHSALPAMSPRVEILDGPTKARRLLPLPGPAHAAAFSPDGRSLLLLALRRGPGRDVADAVVLDIASGRRRLVARDVSEAGWIAR
jgi:hypothetical protein